MNKKKKVIIIFVITSLILTVALFLLLFLKDHHPIWKEITVPIYENGKQVSTGTIPLPPNTRHYNEGMNLDYFITEGDAEDIKKFFDDYVSDMPRARKIGAGKGYSGFYDKEQRVIISEYEVWQRDETHCMFWIAYEQYSDSWNEI